VTTARRARISKGTSRVFAGVLTVAMMGGVLAACGGGNGGSSKPTNTGPETTKGSQGANSDTGGPGKPGGSATIALTAETGGWCLAEAQLAAGGIQVARAIYDTLTVPDDKGNYVPFLAKSVTSNADFTKWTIELRSGIKFSDGTDLTAQVVKNNIDAYRGKYPKRSPLLFIFVFGYVKDVKATGPLTVEVDMNKPWSTFPAHLYEYGRLGMMGQAQLDSGKNCFNDLIGTGPFTFKKSDWVVGDHLTVHKNPNYWRKDQDGNALPYLDSITFKPVIEKSTLVNGIQTGALDMAVTDDNLAIKEFMDLNKSGKIQLKQTDQNSEISYTIFNAKKLPFSNIHARLAFAYAIDADAYNKARQAGLLQQASGPFAPGVLGYLADSGLPHYDPAKAKSEVAAYKADTGKDLSFSLGGTNSSDTLKSLQFQKQYLEAAGMKVTLHQAEESQYINDVIAGSFDAAGWRNHPGFDPDTQYVWWHCDNAPPATQPSTFPAANVCNNLVNFTGFNDEAINKALDDGHTTTDATARQKAYEDLNREFAKQLWEAWGYYVIWSVPYANKLHGVNVLKLPTADSINATGATPFGGYSSGVDPAGLWVG